MFWDRWLSAYYADRVPVTVTVRRVVAWPDLHLTGPPEVFGAPLPAVDAEPQTPPKKGTGPRVDATKTGERAAKLSHRLLAYRQVDGYPAVVPVDVSSASSEGVRLTVPAGVPQGGRRAGLLAHAYRAELVGLESRQNTGWDRGHGHRGAVCTPYPGRVRGAAQQNPPAPRQRLSGPARAGEGPQGGSDPGHGRLIQIPPLA